MASVTIKYLSVTQAEFDTLANSARKEFDIQGAGTTFTGSQHGGLVKMRAIYDPALQQITVDVTYPGLLASKDKIKATIDQWIVATEAPPTLAAT